MSVLIRGMEMPKNCYTCPFCDDVEGVCIVLYAVEHKWERTHSCPLVPVPEHGRLIDADEFYELIDGGFDIDFDELPETKRELLRMIDNAPTVIGAEEGE